MHCDTRYWIKLCTTLSASLKSPHFNFSLKWAALLCWRYLEKWKAVSLFQCCYRRSYFSFGEAVFTVPRLQTTMVSKLSVLVKLKVFYFTTFHLGDNFFLQYLDHTGKYQRFFEHLFRVEMSWVQCWERLPPKSLMKCRVWV